ncbi:Transcriptional regulator containing PAS, AAA-type ATPase, and DNA-binding Fis domains [Caloramator quimbayensis]|uniref:Transcriptional regulator containing PAS, AAA-type ATPase, and DNA-binding Fis domains n=1 Tax=Caloramator quimbayensis TaxID=1147123 RepID=A0A1T4X7H4_9CLOT|nr:sigma 54-interacting transcriptional regulator [Caloramator quimbayensis]SKA84791.1 Transcriptional regulator containing PAS, AAA-type ATPase, and DNA-binding Fis domains [Caloramator quimbayensis]
MLNELQRCEIIEKIPVGVIVVDTEKKIIEINRKAKDIFGIKYRIDLGHDEGKIEEGDIVIIGDNSIGLDDGGIDNNDFKSLGIKEKIKKGSAFVYIGKYKIGGEYKCKDVQSREILSLEKYISGKQCKVEIDFLSKMINIKVDEKQFPYKYIKGIGHVVILDRKSGNIKFYQSKGYSVRKEDLKSILNGKTFMKKFSGLDMETDVIGEKIIDVLGTSAGIQTLIKAVEGNETNFVNEYDEINGRPVRCSVYQIKKKNKIDGAFILVEDLSEINKIINEKEEILKKLLEIEDTVYNPFDSIIGESKIIQELKCYAKKAALSNSTILLLGESGTGKSKLARAIHEYSDRKEKRFVELNCGALSENLLESELFGYEKGAFTGARKEGKKGLIESAQGGTLFLDEISEMPLNLQVKLLHVIQNKKFLPVGSIEPKDIDVRFICASNRDLKKMVENGEFREDLYYRINVIPILIPPLRSRKEDLYLLTESLIREITKKENMDYKVLSDEAFNKLYSYDFPGNVRELENILERAVNICEGNTITDKEIMLNYDKSISTKTLKEILEDAEKKAIVNCLKKYDGDKNMAMKALDIKKTSFYEKIKKYGIKL